MRSCGQLKGWGDAGPRQLLRLLEGRVKACAVARIRVAIGAVKFAAKCLRTARRGSGLAGHARAWRLKDFTVRAYDVADVLCRVSSLGERAGNQRGGRTDGEAGCCSQHEVQRERNHDLPSRRWRFKAEGCRERQKNYRRLE